jgi:hypothetical protein
MGPATSDGTAIHRLAKTDSEESVMAVSNPTLTAGVELTTTNTDNNPRAMDANVYELEPNVAPLTVLMTKLNSRPAGNPKVEWLQDQPMPRITTLSASATSAATAFGVNADIYRVGDVAKFSALGFGVVVTITAAGTIYGTVIGTQVSAQTGAELYMVGNANAEFGSMNEIKIPNLSTIYNYTQIFRTPLGVSGTEDATDHYGGPERARLRKKFGIEHARKIEAAHFFGIRSISSTTRTENGLQSYISTNVTADTAGLTEVEWQTFLVSGFRYGSDRKVAFCSPTAASAIEGFARARFTTADTNLQGATFGISMKTYVSGQGTVDIITHKDWNDSATYGGYIVLADMDALADRPLRNTRLRPDIHAPDADGFKDEYLTETCVQVIWEARHALLTGVAIGSN